jgi:hypothetical protein
MSESKARKLAYSRKGQRFRYLFAGPRYDQEESHVYPRPSMAELGDNRTVKLVLKACSIALRRKPEKRKVKK